MYKKLKNLLSALGYIGFFCGYFYILFFNLVGGFSMNGMETRWFKNTIAVIHYSCRISRNNLLSASPDLQTGRRA